MDFGMCGNDRPGFGLLAVTQLLLAYNIMSFKHYKIKLYIFYNVLYHCINYNMKKYMFKFISGNAQTVRGAGLAGVHGRR